MPGHSRVLKLLLVALALSIGAAVNAQPVTGAVEQLSPDRPEAWAMNYFTMASAMTGFGTPSELMPGQWAVAAELGQIPHLNDRQQRVGFSGFKREDLNKSPVIGRLRGMVGLSGGWVAELGYTPPLAIDGTRTHDLFAAAVGRRLLDRGEFSLSARLFGQHGQVGGDITCPAELAGIEDTQRNPYGCRRASRDRLQLNYYGIELTLARQHGPWQWHAGIATVRTETEVQVDAQTFGVHDRSRLVAKDMLPAITIGTTRAFEHWRWGAEVLYVPLRVRRDEGRSSENDPLVSVRLQLRYESD
jgi:hypothetical protein